MQFFRHCDLRVLGLWQAGRWKEFNAMLPTYAKVCYRDGWMHDTVMLLGALGWNDYRGEAEIVTPYFIASGAGRQTLSFQSLSLVPDHSPRSGGWESQQPATIDDQRVPNHIVGCGRT
jgi:hypothetical protein